MTNDLVVLIGFMGSGKTTIGKMLSRTIGYEFFDSDELVMEVENMSIPEIFNQKGEDYFRRLERDICVDLSKKNKSIVSTGGGAVTNDEIMASFKQTGFIVYLKSTPEKIYENTLHGERPLLAVPDRLRKIRELLSERERFYERYADFTVDVSDISAPKCAEKIAKLFSSRQDDLY